MATPSKKKSEKTGPRTFREAKSDSLLVSLSQGSRETGLPRTSLYTAIVKGALPVVTLDGGGRLWIKRADLASFISCRTERRGAM